MNAATAEIEPHRWHELRRALRVLVWSGGLALTQCLSAFSIPLLIIGARSLARWAPTRAVRRDAQLLMVSGIVQVALVLAVIGAILLDGDNDLPNGITVTTTSVGVVTSLVNVVAWIRAFRGLCVWAQGTHIVDAWDRSIRHLPPTFLVAALSVVGAVVTDETVFALIALAACFWALWLIGHPTWWTYRLFTADLRPAKPVTVSPTPPLPPPPPSPMPSYWD